MTPYETIFNSFLKRIEDEILPKFEESEQNEILIGYLNDAIAMMTADDLMIEHDLNNKDDDLMEFNDDLNNLEVELLSKVMVVSWYEQKINSIETTVMMIGVSGEKWTSQKGLAESMKTRQTKAYREARKLARGYHYRNNNYLGGDK
ncbi:MAG: hypothetical protein MR726_04500 [Ligilactobacillus salivarius]|nr:hypothetical protein [Ligilactobacillus salivarius]